MKIILNIKKSYLYIFITALFVLTGIIYAYAGGYITGTPSHSTLFADIIQGKSGNSIVITEKLGINTTTPANALDVRHAGANTVYANFYTGSSSSQIGNIQNGLGLISTNIISLYTGGTGFVTDGALPTANGATLAMTIDSSGNAGIGVASPAKKLDIGGQVKSTGYCIGANCVTDWGQVQQDPTVGSSCKYLGASGIVARPACLATTGCTLIALSKSSTSGYAMVQGRVIPSASAPSQWFSLATAGCMTGCSKSYVYPGTYGGTSEPMVNTALVSSYYVCSILDDASGAGYINLNSASGSCEFYVCP